MFTYQLHPSSCFFPHMYKIRMSIEELVQYQYHWSFRTGPLLQRVARIKCFLCSLKDLGVTITYDFEAPVQTFISIQCQRNEFCLLVYTSRNFLLDICEINFNAINHFFLSLPRKISIQYGCGTNVSYPTTKNRDLDVQHPKLKTLVVKTVISFCREWMYFVYFVNLFPHGFSYSHLFLLTP